MFEKIEEQKQFYIDLWKNRKPSGVSHTKEMWDEKALRWIEEITAEGKRKDKSERRVSETAAFLRAHGLLKKEDRVIDIGCGPGRFVCEFAKTAGHVTGTDISPNMLKFGKKHAETMGLLNTEFIDCDFKMVDTEEMGWNRSFDLVFSSITPALSTYESFRKAESMSRKYCFQSNYVKSYDPVVDELMTAVSGNEDHTHKRMISGFISLFNILCLEGCFPEINFYTESDVEFLKADDKSVQTLLKYFKDEDKKEDTADRLKDEIRKRAGTDGVLKRPVEWKYGWILWDVREKNINKL